MHFIMKLRSGHEHFNYIILRVTSITQLFLFLKYPSNYTRSQGINYKKSIYQFLYELEFEALLFSSF